MFKILFLVCIPFCLADNVEISLVNQTLAPTAPPPFAVDIIKHKILPQRLDDILHKILKKCRMDVEVFLRNCLLDYDEKIHHQLPRDDLDESSKLGCCGVWQYHDCMRQVVVNWARTSVDSCNENDVDIVDRILDDSSRDSQFRQLCYGYHEGSELCRYEPTPTWLLILVWVVGGTAVAVALFGVFVMLYFVVTGTGHRVRMFIISDSDRKNLLNNMEA